MRARFVAQPLADGYDLRDFLTEAAADPELDHLLVVVAWAKRSGLRLFAELLTGFRARGGRSRLLVGVSEGGATRQGLALALDTFDEVYVVHDVAGRTFHPKIYLARGALRAWALVGSHNLTRGGAVTNYEAGIALELDLAVAEEAAVVADIDAWAAQLLADAAISARLDAALLERLVADPSLRIGDEDDGRARPDGDSDSIEPGEGGAAPVFTRSGQPRRAAPAAGASGAGTPGTLGAGGASGPAPETVGPGGAPGTVGTVGAGGASGTAGASVVTPPPAPRVLMRWSKRLPKADVYGLPTASPTNTVTLVQGGHEIDQTTWFRHTLFGGCAWTTEGDREVVSVDFDVVVRGASLGRQALLVSNKERFASSQGNRTAQIHWNHAMRDLLRAESHVGDFITVERFDDGSFRLTIGPAPTGPFRE